MVEFDLDESGVFSEKLIRVSFLFLEIVNANMSADGADIIRNRQTAASWLMM